MFTGIIAAVGKITALEKRAGDCRLTIAVGSLPLADAHLGDSIAVNGVCLTAIELGSSHFCADVSNETLSRTTLAQAQVGTAVNLELALTPTTRLGGHIVSGHVDGIGQVLDKRQDARSYRFKIQAPAELAKYIAEKGSICIDGISLTVNGINGCVFDVNIVPHTWQHTTLAETRVGSRVNLEVDLLARYLERLLQGQQAAEPVGSGGITQELLHNSGFL